MVSSGMPFIDRHWGGFYKGASYLVVGAKNSGRSLLGLQFAQETIRRNGVCLYFTSMHPAELMKNASSIGFDVEACMKENKLIVVRVADPNDPNEKLNSDQFLIEYLTDIVSIVDQYQPQRVVFDEITAYVSFNNLDFLETAFLKTLEAFEGKNITSVFIISEPAAFESQIIVGTISKLVTATISLNPVASSNGFKKDYHGAIKLIPNVGHTEGEFSGEYLIQNGEGIIIKTYESGKKEEPKASINGKLSSSQYIPLINISVDKDDYLYSNIYNYDDFSLIINNQIALFNSAGQTFYLISFRLDPEAEKQGLLNINQFQNAVRLSTEKRDKICVINNYIVVLVTRSDVKRASGIISKIQYNLPGNDPDYIKRTLKYLSVLCKEINEENENAESLLRSVIKDGFPDSPNFNVPNRFNN
jgi:circadian clock protein KaiC